jgi:hypothetical protein
VCKNQLQSSECDIFGKALDLVAFSGVVVFQIPVLLIAYTPSAGKGIV